MRFNPLALVRSPRTVSRNVSRPRPQGLRIESLEQRALLAIDSGSLIAGGFSPLDTSRDGYVTAVDALLIINELNRNGGGAVSAFAAAGTGGAAAASVPTQNTLDVDGDGFISATDAILVINELNALVTPDQDDLFQIRLEVTDLDDNPITQIAPGGQFKLKGYVLDLRSTGNDGVFAAFADITYESNLASVNGAIDHGIYSTGASGTASPGLLDEIGGISGQFSPPLGPTERLLFSVPMVAGGTPGTINFVADPADLVSPGNPTHNSLLFNDPEHTIGGVPTTMIAYGTATLEVLPGPTLAIADPAPITEGNAGTTQLAFVVTLANGGSETVTVDYTTVAQTATATADFITQSGTLTFAPGQTTQTIFIDIVGDTLDEANETFQVVLSNPSGATLADSTATGTITDDDPAPVVSIASPAATTEGDNNTTLNFTVSLSAASGRTVTVQFATQPGTALAASDYVTTSGTLTFAPGEVSKVIPVTIVGDLVDEATEAFTVVLSQPDQATLGTATATGTILDNDPLPTLAVSNPTVTEPSVGTTNLAFTISLSKASGQPITVSYQTVAGTATAGSDYVAIPPTEVTFAPGETSKTVNVVVNTDAETEENETLVLAVTSVGTPSLSPAQGTGIIQDQVVEGKQLRIRLQATDLDGNPISQVAATDPFLVTAFVEDLRTGEDLNGVFQAYLDILYNTSLIQATGPITYGDAFPNARSGSTATPGVIDEAGGAGTQIFPETPGGEVKLFSVQVVGIAGGVATFTPDPADLSPLHDLLLYGDNGPLNLDEVIFTSTSITVSPPPAVSIGAASVSEGDSGIKQLSFPVTLSAVGTKSITVQYSTTGQTATEGVDYQGTTGSVTFAVGETSKVVTVNIIGDTLDEDNETFLVTLASPTGATIGTGSAVGTIIDDDAAPLVTVGNASATEGFSDAEFVVTLSAASGRTVTVDFATVAGTATAGADYQTVTGQLTFAPGETSKTVTVPVFYDTIAEPTENFSFVLSSAQNATILGGTGTGSISDIALSTLAGWVYIDANKTGVHDAGDYALQGIEITLTGFDLFENFVSIPAFSNSDGSYAFTGLLPGVYTITQSHPAALQDGIDSLGTLGGTLLNDQFFGIVVSVGSFGAEYNFGEVGINSAYLTDGNFYASSLNGRK